MAGGAIGHEGETLTSGISARRRRDTDMLSLALSPPLEYSKKASTY